MARVTINLIFVFTNPDIIYFRILRCIEKSLGNCFKNRPPFFGKALTIIQPPGVRPGVNQVDGLSPIAGHG
jgi:hypothetical protein